MKHILLARSLAVLITFFTGLSIVNVQDNTDTSHDMLLYINIDNVLMLYDPQTRTETELLQNVASPLIVSRELDCTRFGGGLNVRS